MAGNITPQGYLYNPQVYKHFGASENKMTAPAPQALTTTAEKEPVKKETTSTCKNKSKMWYAAGGVLIGAGTIGLIALCAGGHFYNLNKTLRRQINNLQGNVENLSRRVNSSAAERKAIEEELALQKNLTDNLQAKLNGILEENPKVAGKYLDTLAEDYRKISDDVSLGYDPMQPVKNGTMIERKEGIKYIDFRSAKILGRQDNIEGCIEPDKLLREISNLESGNSIKIPFLQDSDKIKISKAPNATLQAENMERLGKLENCDKAINAGITAKWDEEKIARDLLQNFYDGHGHTLDGVNMVVSKTKEGTYKVRIEGKSTYNCEYISADGLSTKSENLEDAGGFGEGLKMVNVSMLAKKLVKKISYGSADWKYDISSNNRYMQRKLNKVAEFDGNFVEFETDSEEFMKKLVKATNFFEHSKNPDFRGLTYENANMGFAFLGKEKKGNFYLTQRFAYGNEKNWENSVDGLNIFFRRKPDAAFTKGRDRSSITTDDLKQILDKFTKDIPDEKALNIIMDLQSVWARENTDAPKAYKILLDSLCHKFSKYFGKTKIDLTNQKFVAVPQHANSRTIERLQEYGYTVCDECLENIGMPNATEVLSMYSAHKPLMPTPQEIKKIKLLGEAVKIVSEQYTAPKLSKYVEELSKIKLDSYIGLNPDKALRILDECPALLKEFEKEFSHTLPPKTDINYEAIASRTLDNFIFNKIENIKNYDYLMQQEIINFIEKNLSDRTFSTELANVFSKIKAEAIIKDNNHKSPIFIFDRNAEKCENTLAEAMIDHGTNQYMGHWVSRDHLKKAPFTRVLATWLHEMLHQYAGDGDPEFGYILTKLLGDTFKITPEQRLRLRAIQKVYEEIK